MGSSLILFPTETVLMACLKHIVLSCFVEYNLCYEIILLR